jgi:hypothetical protein
MHQKPTRAYGRVFYFGKRKEEQRKRELAGMALGGIDPEWDDLIGAENEISEPATRLSLADGPVR